MANQDNQDYDLIEKDIQAIIDAGGSDSDVQGYLKSSGVKYNSPKSPDVKFGRMSNLAQLAGNIGGYKAGAMVGHPIIGSSLGGMVTRPVGNLMDIGEQRVAQAPTNLGKIGALATTLPPAMPFAPILLNPQEKEALFKDMAQTAATETLTMPIKYGIGRAVNAVVGAGKNLFNNLGSKFGGKVRDIFYNYKNELSKSWETQVDKLATKNPNLKVNISEVGQKITALWSDLTQEARSAINKSPALKKIVFGEGKQPTEFTLKQINQIITDLNKTVSKVTPKNASRYIDIKDILTDLKAVRMDAFPEMAKISAEYAKKVTPWNAIHKYMRYGQTMSGIKGGMFKDPELVEAVKNIFPKNVVSQMKGIRDAEFMGKLLRNPITYAVGGIIGGGLGISKALRNNQ